VKTVHGHSMILAKDCKGVCNDKLILTKSVPPPPDTSPVPCCGTDIAG
jgi:hypothetical protein